MLVDLNRRDALQSPDEFRKELFVAKKEETLVRRQPNAIQRYFKETVGELRKVNWPTRKEAVNLTIVVLIVTGIMSAFLGILDFVFTKVFAFLYGIG